MTVDLSLGDTQLILTECRAHGCTREQTAYILATTRWETAHTMKPVREAYWLSDDWRKRNLRYYPWYGRGYVQITWLENYKRAGERLGLDLTTNPDVVMRAETAARVLVRGMMEGWFTGRALTKYINDQVTDYREARRVVNGTDRAHEIAALAREYEAVIPVKGPPAPTGWIAAILNIIRSIFGRDKT